MKKINFSYDPIFLLKMLIQIIYEQEINQFKNEENDIFSTRKIRNLASEVIFNLDDAFIENEIALNLSKNGVVTIDATNNDFRKELWMTFIDSNSFKQHMESSVTVTSGVFDKRTKNQYYCGLGKHNLGIYQALEDAGLLKSTIEEKDNYVMRNLKLVGRFSVGYRVDLDKLYTHLNKVSIIDFIKEYSERCFF